MVDEDNLTLDASSAQDSDEQTGAQDHLHRHLSCSSRDWVDRTSAPTSDNSVGNLEAAGRGKGKDCS